MSDTLSKQPAGEIRRDGNVPSGAQSTSAPGKRPLQRALQPSAPTTRSGYGHGTAAVPHNPAAQAMQMKSAAETERWMPTAMRPDVNPAPVQRAASGGATEASGLPSGGAGKAMPEDVQAKMEATFDTDFSAVRIHEGGRAPAIGAQAYAQGTDLHFAPGQYQPNSQSGQELLGHELTHVVQQSHGRVSATTQAKGVAVNDDAGLEAEADAMGAKAARGERVSNGQALRGVGLEAGGQRSERNGLKSLSSSGALPIQAQWLTGQVSRYSQGEHVIYIVTQDGKTFRASQRNFRDASEYLSVRIGQNIRFWSPDGTQVSNASYVRPEAAAAEEEEEKEEKGMDEEMEEEEMEMEAEVDEEMEAEVDEETVTNEFNSSLTYGFRINHIRADPSSAQERCRERLTHCQNTSDNTVLIPTPSEKARINQTLRQARKQDKNSIMIECQTAIQAGMAGFSTLKDVRLRVGLDQDNKIAHLFGQGMEYSEKTPIRANNKRSFEDDSD